MPEMGPDPAETSLYQQPTIVISGRVFVNSGHEGILPGGSQSLPAKSVLFVRAPKKLEVGFPNGDEVIAV